MTKSFDFELEENDQVIASLQRIQAAIQNLQISLDQIRIGLQLVGQSSITGFAALGEKSQGVAKNAQGDKQSIDKSIPPLNTLTELNVGLNGLANVIERVKKGVVNFAEKGERIISNGKNMDKPTEAVAKNTESIKENSAARGDTKNIKTSLIQHISNTTQDYENKFNRLLPSQVIMLHNKNKVGSGNNPQVDNILKRLMSLPPVLQNILGNGTNLFLDTPNNLHQASNEVPYMLDRSQHDRLARISRNVRGPDEKQPQSKQAVVNQFDLNIAKKAGLDELKAKKPIQNESYNVVQLAQNTKKVSGEKQRAVYIPSDEKARRAQYLAHLDTQYILPPGSMDLDYLLESSRGIYLRSPAGAEGPFQFMPSSGKEYNLITQADRMDFYKSADAAAQKLSDNLKTFHGNVPQAFAAYNAGASRYKKRNDKKAEPLSQETLNYEKAAKQRLTNYWPVGDRPWYAKKTSEEASTHRKKSVKRPTPIKEPANINAPKLGSALNSPDSSTGKTDITAMNNNSMQIELTLINSQTGKRNVITATGPKVTAAMSYA